MIEIPSKTGFISCANWKWQKRVGNSLSAQINVKIFCQMLSKYAKFAEIYQGQCYCYFPRMWLWRGEGRRSRRRRRIIVYIWLHCMSHLSHLNVPHNTKTKTLVVVAPGWKMGQMIYGIYGRRGAAENKLVASFLGARMQNIQKCRWSNHERSRQWAFFRWE